jgi:hypothetical protein
LKGPHFAHVIVIMTAGSEIGHKLAHCGHFHYIVHAETMGLPPAPECLVEEIWATRVPDDSMISSWKSRVGNVVEIIFTQPEIERPCEWGRALTIPARSEKGV